MNSPEYRSSPSLSAFSCCAKLSLLVLSICLIASTSLADTLFVSPVGGTIGCLQDNPCSLNTAMTAPAGSTLYLASGSYTGTGSSPVFTVSRDLTIIGGWDGTTTTPVVIDPSSNVSIIDGEGSRRCIEVSFGVSITIEGLTITNGYVTSTVPDDTIYGAGLYSFDASQITLQNLIFNNNYAIINTSLAGTNAYGGGAYVKGGLLSVESSVFKNNAALSQMHPAGGGLAIEETVNALVKDCLFQDNDSWHGSGLSFHNGNGATSSLIVKNNRFIDNGKGNSKIARGGYGGALETTEGIVSIENNTFQGNKASNDCGGLRIYYSQLELIGNEILINNSYRTSGICLNTVSSFTIINNYIVDNSQSSDYQYSAAVNFRYSTGEFTHNTVANNDNGYGISLIGSDLIMTNNIVAQPNTGLHADLDSTAALNGTLWWNNPTDSTGEGGISIGSVNIHGDPRFKNPSNFDYHITLGSAARNSGVFSRFTDDFDGDPRPQATLYDIGADEIKVGNNIHNFLLLLLE